MSSADSPLWRCSSCDRTYAVAELEKWIKSSGCEFSSMRVRHTFCRSEPAGILQRDPFVEPKIWEKPAWEKDVRARGIAVPDDAALKALGYTCAAEFFFVLGFGGNHAAALHLNGTPKWAIVAMDDPLRLQWRAGAIATYGSDELLKVPDFIMGSGSFIDWFMPKMTELMKARARAQGAKV